MSEIRVGEVLWIAPDTPRYPDYHTEFPLRVVGFTGQRGDGRIYVDGVRLHPDTSADLEPIRVMVEADHPRAVRRWGPPPPPMLAPRRLPEGGADRPDPAPPPGYTRRYPP